MEHAGSGYEDAVSPKTRQDGAGISLTTDDHRQPSVPSLSRSGTNELGECQVARGSAASGVTHMLAFSGAAGGVVTCREGLRYFPAEAEREGRDQACLAARPTLTETGVVST